MTSRLPIAPLRIAVLAALLATLGVSGVVVAQEPVTLSAAQQQLNDEGVEAIIAGEYERAIAAFKSSLALGESNVTWLNLGRALHRYGECREALAAYGAAESAARVAQPTPAEVDEILARYRGELDPAQCPAHLTLVCKPSSLRVSIDGDEPVACPEQPLRLDPGSHEIVALYKDERRTETLTLEGMEARELSITFDVLGPAAEVAPPVDTAPRADEGVSALVIAGWSGVGLGGAALVTALALELSVLQDYVDQSDAGTLDPDELDSAETLQGVNLGLYIGGGLLAATGIALLIVDALADDAGDAAAQHLVTPLVLHHGGGLGWQVRF